MEYEIEAGGEQIHMAAQCLAHAALDAVALMCLADYFAYRKPNARAVDLHCLRSQKPTHRCGLVLAPGSIGSLIVGVFAQTCAH